MTHTRANSAPVEDDGLLQRKQLQPIRLFKSPEAERLAGLSSIYQDLGYVQRTVEQLVEALDDNPKTHHREDKINLLWSSALIMYARCFASGKRLGLKPSIFESLPGEPLEVHNYFINQRSKLISHSVNPFEQIQVGFHVDPDHKVVGVVALTFRLMSTDRDGCLMFRDLIAFARQYVAERAKEEEARLLIIGQSLSKEEVSALPKQSMTAPSPEQASNARK